MDAIVSYSRHVLGKETPRVLQWGHASRVRKVRTANPERYRNLATANPSVADLRGTPLVGEAVDGVATTLTPDDRTRVPDTQGATRSRFKPSTLPVSV